MSFRRQDGETEAEELIRLHNGKPFKIENLNGKITKLETTDNSVKAWARSKGLTES